MITCTSTFTRFKGDYWHLGLCHSDSYFSSLVVVWSGLGILLFCEAFRISSLKRIKRLLEGTPDVINEDPYVECMPQPRQEPSFEKGLSRFLSGLNAATS